MSSTSMVSMATTAGAVVGSACRVHAHTQISESSSNVHMIVTSSSLKSATSTHRTGNPLKCGTQDSQQGKRRANLMARASAGGGRELFQATGGRDLYQPFRPPPSIIQQGLKTKSVDEMLQILRDKEGLWFQYAAYIPILQRSGFSPSEIDESTGINGHEQNKLVVGSQVRASLVSSGFDKDAIQWFDNGGAEILYELRTLSAQQRRASAEYIMGRNMDGKGARDLSKAVKDFDKRRSVQGWESFSSCPGDCLAFSFLRMSKDARTKTEVDTLIHQGLEFVETESARKELERSLNQDQPESAEEKLGKATVTIMRLSSETIPVVLPVCEFSLQSVRDSPSSPVFAATGSPFPIYTPSVAWQTFVSVNGWKPIVEAAAPVAIALPDSSIIPKKSGIRNYTEPCLLVVDKADVTVVTSSYFLVNSEEGLNLKPGPEVSKEKDTVLGKVLIALKPPPNSTEDERDWDMTYVRGLLPPPTAENYQS
ncbi:hypothetical protein R1sor_015643 [Riccia sorocarpa]|uniref:Uncharacterized protein n=1 Tax=Riccia sorocarpa TaxID=122646 RepID=A0ABD3HGR6_9MARC